MDIPEDIRAAARIAIHDKDGRGMIGVERRFLEQRIARALMAERERSAQAARDYLANEYMPDFGSLPDDLAAAIRSVPASLEEE